MRARPPALPKRDNAYERSVVLISTNVSPWRARRRFPLVAILKQLQAGISVPTNPLMSQSFEPGDDLIFQLESGYGLLRVLATEGEGESTVWHLLAYDDFFPDVEAAEKALAQPGSLPLRKAHLPLTNRAFERTPAARLGNRPVSDQELGAYREWLKTPDRQVYDRSALLMLGVR